MTFIKRTEQEFGEPFVDVLQGFADMGYGCNTTARMLEYNVRTFRWILKRYDIAVSWPTAKNRIDAYERNPWPGCKAMVKARREKAPIYTHPDTGERLTATQWAERLGISCTQFLRRVKAHGQSRRVFLPNLRRSA